MPARTALLPQPRAPRATCESSSFVPSWSFHVEGVLGTPLEAHPSAPGLERVGRRRLEVLPDHRQLAPGIELDGVPREHADVDDVPDPPGLAAVAGVEVHLDLLGPHREAPTLAFEHVRDADEAGDELRRRVLVDLR